MEKLAKVTFYSTVDEFKRSGAKAVKDRAVKANIISSAINEWFLQLSEM